MKRMFSVMVQTAAGTNVVENVVVTSIGTITEDKRAAEDAVEAAYSGSSVLSANYTGVVDREV